MNDPTPETIRDLWPTWWLIRRLGYWFVSEVPQLAGRGEVIAALLKGEAATSSEEASALAEDLGEWWQGYGSPDPPRDPPVAQPADREEATQ